MRIWPAMLLLTAACPGSGPAGESKSGSGAETAAVSKPARGTGADQAAPAQGTGAGQAAPAQGTGAAAPGQRAGADQTAPVQGTGAGQAVPAQGTGADQAAPAQGTGPAEALRAAGAPVLDAAARVLGGPCKSARFESSVAVAEASGAVWVEASFGMPDHVVIVGDSGTRGAFAVIDAESGALLDSGRLPLDRRASDDIEGFARAGGVYYALTSAGSVRQFRRTGAVRFELAAPSYELAGVACDSPRRTNCGRDFEGLCVVDRPGGSGCAGFAASRRDGDLVCLKRDAGGRLRADPSQVIHVVPKRALATCEFAPAPDRTLYVGTNLFGGNALLRVRGWEKPASAQAEPLATLGIGFIEAIAVGPGGAIYYFSDTASPTSGMGKYSCPRAGPE